MALCPVSKTLLQSLYIGFQQPMVLLVFDRNHQLFYFMLILHNAARSTELSELVEWKPFDELSPLGVLGKPRETQVENHQASLGVKTT